MAAMDAGTYVASLLNRAAFFNVHMFYLTFCLQWNANRTHTHSNLSVSLSLLSEMTAYQGVRKSRLSFFFFCKIKKKIQWSGCACVNRQLTA